VATSRRPRNGGSVVPDDVNALAQEYFDFLLTAWPTWGHLMGNYEHVDLFDDASRAGEEAEMARRLAFADRAEAVDATGLSTQDAITREMLIFDGRRNADILDARFAEFAIDPASRHEPAFSRPSRRIPRGHVCRRARAVGGHRERHRRPRDHGRVGGHPVV
jgi:uncharacterized protein (DUF885 family)